MAMDMVEVDPKLFVTCRLCLEDLGQYQIVPSVQQQIKYCFDIHVESFDGLPQLICTKCKTILNNFYKVKKTFSDKQTDLKSKLLKKEEINVQPQHDTVSSSQQPSESNEEIKAKVSKKRKRIVCSSSSDLESEKSCSIKKKKSSRHHINKPVTWEADYQKHMVCKLCYSSHLNKRAITNHIRSHYLLTTRYKNIFNRQCTVNLEKLDNIPNITGLGNMVVHNSNKIISPGNSYYYTVYSKKKSDISNHLDSKEPENSCTKSLNQESTDDEEAVSKPKHKKRRQISRSSNETVVIETNGNKVLSDNEEDSNVASNVNIEEPITSINIDDSSDSDSGKGNIVSSQMIKQPIEAKLGDYKIIHGIISTCINSYQKKNETADVDVYMDVMQNKTMVRVPVTSESQLKHKVLSIGRKIINKQGFNCTGLLRYMEQKNLEIVWMTKALTSSNNKETNYIRILTKLRGPDTTNDNTGWVKISKGSDSKHSTYDATEVTIETSRLVKKETSQLEQSKENSELDTTPAMLYYDNSAITPELKKLLNANPVANPKQLPKKVVQGNDSRPLPNKTLAEQNISTLSDNEDSNFCMPIITSTTSLAAIPNTENKEEGNQSESVSCAVTTEKETPVPRIKVKPVSELMSERILNSLMTEQLTPATNSNMLTTQIESVWPHQQPINVFVPNIAPQMHVAAQPIQIVQIPGLNLAPTYPVMPNPTTSNIKKDYVILDSNDLPNTKTDSPFKYLKDLLQIHNIVLLDPCTTLPRDFDCLIKFKVFFKQETVMDQSVVLCLSLYCCKNAFCLRVRDRNQLNMDINKISANWQWEILKQYRGEVVMKVLQNAQKISQETYNFTNNFFCLLKSISCINQS